MPEKNYYSLSMNVMISSIIVLLLLQLILAYNTINMHLGLNYVLMNQFILTVFTINTLSIVFVTASLYYYSRYGSVAISRIQQFFEHSLESHRGNSIKKRIIKWFLDSRDDGFDLYKWTRNNIEKFALLLIALIFLFNSIKYMLILNPDYSIALILRSIIMPHTLLEMLVYYFMIIVAVKFSNNPVRILKILMLAITLLFIAAITEAHLTPILSNMLTHM